MLIRTYADITKLKGKAALSPAEKTLIENCKLGEPTILGDGTRPDAPRPERTIRADLLRYLILGGCERCRVHEKGVLLVGARIEGKLDLSFARARGAVRLLHCAFDVSVAAKQSSFVSLSFTNSSLPALNAEGAIIRGDVFLSNLTSTGEVSFSGTEISGQLVCNNAKLNCELGISLNMQRAKIGDSVFLRELKSTGQVSFSGTEIGGQLLCMCAELMGGGGASPECGGRRS